MKADPASPVTGLVIDWSAPANTGPSITGYALRYRVDGTEAWTQLPGNGIATSKTIGGLSSGTAYEVQVRAVNDEGAGAWSDSGRGATDEANQRPGFDGEAATREIAENALAGWVVGAPVTAVDPDGDALTYSMAGPSEFVIDAATGQISVAEGASLDYESVRSYSATVSVSDGMDFEWNPDAAADATIQVTIAVTDVDEGALSITNPGDKEYQQGETIESFVIAVQGGPAAVSLSGLPAWLAYSNGVVGGTVARDAEVADYEVTITASSAARGEVTATFNIAVVAADATHDWVGAGSPTRGAFYATDWFQALAVLLLLLLIAADYKRRRSRRARAERELGG